MVVNGHKSLDRLNLLGDITPELAMQTMHALSVIEIRF